MPLYYPNPLPLANGGTGANLSATGGTSQVLKQTTAGAVVTVAQLAFTDISGSVAAAQMPALTGDVTTSAGAVATTAAATQANIATLSKSTGVAVHGTNTNDNAAAAYVGEYISASQTTLTDFPATNVYGDLTSMSLTAGDWDVTAVINIVPQGGVYTQFIIGISATSGNDSTGLVFGDNANQVFFLTGSNCGGSIPAFRVSLSGTTTYYLKYLSTYTSTTAKGRGRISARRMR